MTGMDTTYLPERAGRHCQKTLNSLHSMAYFGPELATDLAEYGVEDPMTVYLAARSAALGSVGPGAVTAALYGFEYRLIARHIPHVWTLVPPGTVVELRLRAADAVLRRSLGEEGVGAPEMAEAADLALRAAGAAERSGRVMFSAHADQPVPREPHLALWYAATLLREHRGDAHIAALQHAGLGGLDALVADSASEHGMPKEMGIANRGWTPDEWSAAEARLRDRGLMDAEGRLTSGGVRLRADLETETDRLDRAPYERLGAAGVARLTELTGGFTAAAAAAGAFPADLREFFARR